MLEDLSIIIIDNDRHDEKQKLSPNIVKLMQMLRIDQCGNQTH